MSALDRAHAWLDENFDESLTLQEWLDRVVDSGWAAPGWAVTDFGLGLDNDEVVSASAAFRERRVPMPSSRSLAASTILVHGTEEQRYFVRDILTARASWCQLFSEPGAGSDLASLQTKAERDGDVWIVNGQKVWTSGATGSDFGMLIARTDLDAPKHSGITWFALPMDQPGVEIRPLRQMNNAATFNEVFFTDAQVPHENVIGGVNNGWAAAVTTLANERVNLSGATAGIGGTPVPVGSRSREIRETTTVRDFVQRGGRTATTQVPQARRTDREGKAERLFELAKSLGVDDHQVIRQELMRYYSNQQVSRLNMLRSKGAAAAGNRPGPEGSIGKLLRSRITRGNRDLGPAILGAHGMLWDDPHSPDDGQSVRATLSAPSSSIAGGTDEVQANIIGERVLGLPKEPSADTDVPFKELKVGTQRSG